MTNIEIVSECIDAWPGGICDKCIGRITNVKPHPQVVQICQKLVARNKSVRIQGECSNCRERRLLNEPMVVDVHRNTKQPQKQPPVTEEAITPRTSTFFEDFSSGTYEPLAHLTSGRGSTIK